MLQQPGFGLEHQSADRIMAAQMGFDGLFDSVFPTTTDTVQEREFELPLTGSEVMQALRVMHLHDLLASPGGFVDLYMPVHRWGNEFGTGAGGNALAKFSVSHAGRELMGLEPTQMHFSALHDPSVEEGIEKRTLAVSLYYGRGRVDMQQILGYYWMDGLGIEAFRVARVEVDDRKVYSEFVRRKAKPHHISAFAGRAQELINAGFLVADDT